MAEHIKTIQEREFVVKQQQKLVPTTLGIALVTGAGLGLVSRAPFLMQARACRL